MSPIDVAVAGAAQPPEGADPFSLGDAEAAALILDGAGFDDCASCTSARKSRAPTGPPLVRVRGGSIRFALAHRPTSRPCT